MAKDVTEGRSLHRTLAPDTGGPETRKPTSRRGIADKAKADKQRRFRDLYRCLNVELLLECWGELHKDAASGVDGVTWQAYAEHLQANVEALVERLKQKRSRAKLIRRHYIPKGNGQERPFGIPGIEDKLLQAAGARILTAIYAQECLACSDGYRPKRHATHPAGSRVMGCRGPHQIPWGHPLAPHGGRGNRLSRTPLVHAPWWHADRESVPTIQVT
jgi:RNA-directed DNA polymerase